MLHLTFKCYYRYFKTKTFVYIAAIPSRGALLISSLHSVKLRPTLCASENPLLFSYYVLFIICYVLFILNYYLKFIMCYLYCGISILLFINY